MFKGLIRGAIVVVIMWLSLASARVIADVQKKPEATTAKEDTFEMTVFVAEGKWDYDKVEFYCFLNERGQKAQEQGRPISYEHLRLGAVIVHQGESQKQIPAKELGPWKKRLREFFSDDRIILALKVA
jgi:hypothetical protein